MAKTFDWLLVCQDEENGASNYCIENATIWEVKKEIARCVRVLRYGYRHLLGTEYPKDVKVRADGTIYGWCITPVVGKCDYTARVATFDEIKNLTDARDLDHDEDGYRFGIVCNSRYKPDHDCTFTGGFTFEEGEKYVIKTYE